MKEAFGSTCHGAGRVMSRNETIRRFTVQGIRNEMEGKRDIPKVGHKGWSDRGGP